MTAARFNSGRGLRGSAPSRVSGALRNVPCALGDFARPESAEAESPDPSRPPPRVSPPPAGPGFEPAEPDVSGRQAAGKPGPRPARTAGPGTPAREGRAGWEGRAGRSAGPTRGPRPAAGGPREDAPARPERASRRAGRGRAGDGTKAPLLSDGRRRVTHNGGESRLSRRARRGALLSRPAGAPRTRTHIYLPDFSDSSRECRAHRQPPVSAQVSGCAGGSGVSEALALPQSPPCNPDPRERARKRGRRLWSHAPGRHRLTPRVPPPPPGPARRHAPEFPTPVTGLRAPRGRQEKNAGLSPASGWMRWAGLGSWQGGEQTGSLRSATCPSVRAHGGKLFVSVYCTPTTCMGLDGLEERDCPIPWELGSWTRKWMG
ncbi:PREDICTED: translation initiation factor IF-2-like [Capra hircus]|uniref:translation initiation factor IF-2-like n=1 Tax=Capra hircus TaxID=9925 RepID=UPI0008469106|nr:PREDICTED: translation initiation factor IF-2-like [Capra hircus]